MQYAVGSISDRSGGVLCYGGSGGSPGGGRVTHGASGLQLIERVGHDV